MRNRRGTVFLVLLPLSPPHTTRWPHQFGIGPDDHKDPPPPLFSQSWRGCRADVSEGKRVFVFWSPEETSNITHTTYFISKLQCNVNVACQLVYSCRLPSATLPSSSMSVFLKLDKQ
ncbi:hypothetical protein JOB18_016830 [Solea senegalensis]|uniref:Secreted protein n=1 Tax=Solea senegalensis TaxID=28829 RepID=A0AAV6SN81_SOLSE|nr:hypothetical protein JOB18_016830 [Solea senegalensis]